VFTAVGGIDVDAGTAECAAVFLFGFVFNSCEMESTEERLSKLHAYFGQISRRLFADVCTAVHYIRSCLSDASIDEISAALDPAAKGYRSANEEFGRNIKAALDYSSAVNDEDLDWLESDEDNGPSASGFSMNYSGSGVSQCEALQVGVRDMETETSNSKPQKTSCRAWLYEEVASYFCSENGDPDTCVDDLVSTVFDILCSSKSNEQLQTEVSQSCSAKYARDSCLEYEFCKLNVNCKIMRKSDIPFA